MPTPRNPFPAAIAAALALAMAARAQTSELFLMAGDQSTFNVIQGGVRLRSWSVAPGSAQYQYPIAVTNVVRTTGANVNEIGALYDFNGTDLTLRYPHPAGTARCWDGTTDGTNNYAIDNVGAIFRFQSDWTNPVLLFSVSTFGGIAYDATTNSLWVSLWTGNTITNYTMGGTVITSFNAGHQRNMALALDPADGTLWLHDRNLQGTFEQWSRTGTLLNRIAVPGMTGQNCLGGEFSLGNFAFCSFRNGNGVNQPDYACVTRPVLGTSWTTSFNPNANTVLTGLAMTFAPATGPLMFGGEVLVALTPSPVVIIGSGSQSLAIPNNQGLIGFRLATQGLRFDNLASGLQPVLLNAQDIQVGL
jgi:hypothetical protein